ncbi:MAG: response regulator, partial [Chloroflexi bacterium]
MMKKILVVDDDESILEVVQIALESEGYHVQTITNSRGLQKLTNDRPDLILLDMILGGEDGRILCQRLKSNEETRLIPVIILSAHSDAGQVADTSGADDFLEKPFDIDALLDMVE